MYRVSLPETARFAAWRAAARGLAAHHIPAGDIDWTGDSAALFAFAPLPGGQGRQVTVSAGFLELAARVILNRDPAAPALLYKALLALQDRQMMLSDAADPLVRRLRALEKAVARDIHKMRAFVRFRELVAPGPRRRFAAWFEPDHMIVEHNAGFFARRFADMDWAIHTPYLSVECRDGAVSFAPGAPRPDLPDDAAEGLWATYFANIFNPARANPTAMRQQMPLKYWKNLPETAQIPAMLAAAEQRVHAMRDAMPSTAPARADAITRRYRAGLVVPDRVETLDQARAACAGCIRCALCHDATQAVFGDGPHDARLMIVGEQPDDHDDLAGRPFAGPAGQVLDNALAQAGLARDAVWLTYAVKHFKFTARGGRRLYQRPDADEVQSCQWWLAQEHRHIRPRLTVALGPTAALALTGRRDGLSARRGGVEQTPHGPVLVTEPLAAIMEQPGSPLAQRLSAALAADVTTARKMAFADDA